MSLFGGPLPPAGAQDDTPFMRSSSIIPPSSPPPLPTEEPLSSIERDLSADNEASDEYTGSESEDERPRFQGKWWTYRNYIQEERDLAASLAQLRAEDLGLHLYNAHALKQRARAERAALKKNRADHTGEKPWMPPRLWTAWPLEPSQVPRPYERFAPLPTIDPDDEHTIRPVGYDQQKPSREMEEIMVGIVLKNAKERFNKRKWEDERETDARAARSTSRRRSRAASRMTDDESDAGRRSRAASASRAATPTGSRPVITTDDDRAHRILQPSIRSSLTQLDTLLMALHRSQLNRNRGRARHGGDDTETGADTAGETTDAPSSRASKRRKRNQSASEGELGVKRRRGRPPKPILQAAAIAAESTADVTEAEPPATPPGASPRKRQKGRPRKYPRPLPGESWYMMRKRVDQLRAAGLDPLAASGESNGPSRAQTAEPEPEPESSRPASPAEPVAAGPARARSDSTASEDSEVREPKTPRWNRGRKVVRLRDWREVLGTAAMLGGFKPAVIERATRRCVDLFGEGMLLRVLEESNALDAPGELVEYVPDTVPPPEDMESEENEEMKEGEEEDGKPTWDGVSLKCPHHECPRYTEAYDSRWRLREHVKKKHGYKLQVAGDEVTETEGETITSKAKVNYADLVGAVHNDGFLKALPRRPGWVKKLASTDNGASQPPPVVSAETGGQEKDKTAQRRKKGKRAPGF